MTAALIGVIVGLVAVLGVLAGFAWWATKRAMDATDRYVKSVDQLLDVRKKLTESQNQQRATHDTLIAVQKQRDRLEDARTVSQERINELQEMLIANAESDDPHLTANGVRATLDRVRALSEIVSDMPDVSTSDHG